MRGSIGKIRVDWVSIVLYLILVFVGWVNIYSSTVTENDRSIFDFRTINGKQLFFIAISLCAAGLILNVNTKAF